MVLQTIPTFEPIFASTMQLLACWWVFRRRRKWRKYLVSWNIVKLKRIKVIVGFGAVISFNVFLLALLRASCARPQDRNHVDIINHTSSHIEIDHTVFYRIKGGNVLTFAAEASFLFIGTFYFVVEIWARRVELFKLWYMITKMNRVSSWNCWIRYLLEFVSQDCWKFNIYEIPTRKKVCMECIGKFRYYFYGFKSK